jgi:hypothetical protein
VATKLYDSWNLGATFLWDLLQRTGATAADAIAASSHAGHAEAYDRCVFLDACLQPAAATTHWIEPAVSKPPPLADHPDLMHTLAAFRADSEGSGLDLARCF